MLEFVAQGIEKTAGDPRVLLRRGYRGFVGRRRAGLETKGRTGGKGGPRQLMTFTDGDRDTAGPLSLNNRWVGQSVEPGSRLRKENPGMPDESKGEDRNKIRRRDAAAVISDKKPPSTECGGATKGKTG